MAAISSDIEVEPTPRNTRVNEIVAIGLIATALLLGLCLASYNPNDPSWNAAGGTGVHNWIGAVGANVAAGLFQGIGLAAYLLPFLLLAAAWRRVRSRRINSPMMRLVGLVVLVLSASALLSLANIRPFFDSSFNAGGLTGAIIARALVAGLNTIGAAILLSAIAATGVLLATRFSFAAFYEKVSLLFSDRFSALRAIPERFHAWRQARRERKILRGDARRQARAERAALKAGNVLPMGEAGASPQIAPIAGARVDGELAEAFASFSAATSAGAKTMAAAAGAATAPARRSIWPSRGKSLPAAESAKIDEMMREAAVKRKTESPASGSLPFDGDRRISTRTLSDYKLPAVEFLHAAQMRRELADDGLLNMAARLAEKCREVSVSGQ